MEHAVDEDAVLAVAQHVKIGVLEEHFQMPPRNEAGVSHIHVHIAPGAIPADDDPILLDQVLEIPAVDASYRVPLIVGAPLHPRRARWLRLQREKGPGIAFRRHRE